MAVIFIAGLRQWLTRPWIPEFICLSILCGILWAGLTPFHSPRNRVFWIPDRNGLRFQADGTALSTGTIPVSRRDGAGTIEIWLSSSRPWRSNTFLAFSSRDNPLLLTMRQRRAGLVLKSAGHPYAIEIPDVFRQGRTRFVTVTSGPHGTAVYVDGVLAKSTRQIELFGNGLAGDLVLGTSPLGSDSWSGELRGLAVYQTDLPAANVVDHYRAWTRVGRPDTRDQERRVALFLFNERKGNLAYNTGGSGIDLYLPDRYTALHHYFLEPFWKEYTPTWGYWKSVLVNIAGFIPLGFVFFGYWKWVRPIRCAALATIVFGSTVSFTIEVLQGALPTRQSGTTDLFTNTLGTALGVLGWKLARILYRTWPIWSEDPRSVSECGQNTT